MPTRAPGTEGITRQREARKSKPQSASPSSRLQRRSSICSGGPRAQAAALRGGLTTWVPLPRMMSSGMAYIWFSISTFWSPLSVTLTLSTRKLVPPRSKAKNSPCSTERGGPLLVGEAQIQLLQRPKLKVHKHRSALRDRVASRSYFFLHTFMHCLILFLNAKHFHVTFTIHINN